MMKLGMQTLTLGLAIPTLCAAYAPAQAARVINPVRPISPATVQVDQAQIQIHARTPIPFVPFPLADLKTGRKLSADEMITLENGKQIKAGEYITEINRLEREFNALGYSLRQPGVFKLQSLKVDQQLLKNQIAIFQAEPRATFRTANKGGDPGPLGPLPPGVSGSGSISKSWERTLGSKYTLGASIKGTLDLVGNSKGVTASGTARATGAILGTEWDFVRMTGSLNSQVSGTGNAKLNLYVVGVGDLPLVNQNFSQSGYAASNTVSRQVDVYQDFNFYVGPIPMTARLGARGSAGLQYGLTANQGKLGVTLTPKVQVDAYGQGGVNLFIASGGLGCQLVLLKDELRLGAEGGIEFVGRPCLQGRIYAYNNMEALAGSIYAWARVWPAEWQWEIWKFGGVKVNTVLFDETQTIPFTP